VIRPTEPKTLDSFTLGGKERSCYPERRSWIVSELWTTRQEFRIFDSLHYMFFLRFWHPEGSSPLRSCARLALNGKAGNSFFFALRFGIFLQKLIQESLHSSTARQAINGHHLSPYPIQRQR
jgi:hypothetical protein